MYASIQTVCGCHGYLLFESIYCDRCRSLIPFQLTDESLTDPVTANNILNGMNNKVENGSKKASNMLVPYRKLQQQQQQQQQVTTGRVRFRALCPFCNSATYVLRYYCKRERLYYHLRLQTFGESDQSLYKSIAETQRMNNHEYYATPKRDPGDSSITETGDDSYSLSGSTSRQPPSTILYDQSRVPNARDIQIENEKKLYTLNDLEGDLFNVLRNGLFYDTMVQCQDDVKLQVHRCILGGRSPWFRHLLSEYHNTNSHDDYVLQISIDDVHSDVMNEILNFMYTNRCLISIKNAPDLLVASKRFELHKLTKQIADFLLSRLNVDNAIEMLISAHEANSEPLKLACIRLINRNAEKIKRTEKWKTFKTQYVDLVPELYESRVERLEPAQAAFLPDVFSAPVVPSESLLSLTKLYENPVQQRFPSPAARILPPPSPPIKHQHVPPPPPMFRATQQAHSNEPVTEAKSGPFIQRNDSTLSLNIDDKNPVKKRAASLTRYRPAPMPAAAPLTRNIFPTVKQTAEIDAYRRPVNVYEKSVALPTNNQKHHSVHTQAPQKAPPPVKVSRAVSPRRVIEIRPSPSLSDIQPQENARLVRAVSTETMD